MLGSILAKGGRPLQKKGRTMAVFKCSECRRLVYLPDDLLEYYVLPCPTCGPQRIVDKPDVVNFELAALLEKEYQLALASPSAVRYGPDYKRPVLGRKIKTDSQASGKRTTLIYVGAIVIAVHWIAFCTVEARNIEDFSFLLVLGIPLGALFTIAYVLSILIGNGIRFRRVQKALKAVASSMGRISGKSANDAVMPAMRPKPEATIQSADGNATPSNEHKG
jgi:hypothetical protein